MFIVKSIEDTKKLLVQKCQDYPLKTAKVNVEDALGHVSSETVYSTIDIPHFHRSTVDGYAVIHEIASQASQSSPVPLKPLGSVEMGKPCKDTLDENTTIYVPTGGHIPANATAVVMIENTDPLGDEILINKRVSKWENVLLKGSDVKQNTPIILKNQRITPTRIGALKAAGVDTINVFQKLKAILLSTGDEITDTLPLSIGEILDINTHTIKHYLTQANVDVVDTIVIRDDFTLFEKTIKNALETYDLVFASGGSSVGDRDYTYNVMAALNADVFVHGINIKPGKPTVLAKHNHRLFIGLPGQPTSAYMVLQTLFPTIYRAIYGLDELDITPYIEGILSQNLASAQGRTTYQLVTVEMGQPLLVHPIHSKSGMIRALKDAYGYIVMDAGDEGYSKGDTVRVYRLGGL